MAPTRAEKLAALYTAEHAIVAVEVALPTMIFRRAEAERVLAALMTEVALLKADLAKGE